MSQKIREKFFVHYFISKAPNHMPFFCPNGSTSKAPFLFAARKHSLSSFSSLHQYITQVGGLKLAFFYLSFILIISPVHQKKIITVHKQTS